MKKSIFVFCTVLLLAIAACNNPLDKKYNKETVGKDVQEMLENKKIDSADLGLMMGYMLMAGFKGESLEGKTYRQIIDGGREMKKQMDEKK